MTVWFTDMDLLTTVTATANGRGNNRVDALLKRSTPWQGCRAQNIQKPRKG